MRLFITILIWGALFQGLLLGLIFITSKKYKSFANSLLGIFLLAFVFQAFTDILPFNSIWGYSISSYFTLPEVKWLLPVLFVHFVLVKVGRSSAFNLFLTIQYTLAFIIIGLTPLNIILFLTEGITLLELLGWELMDQIYMSLQYYAFLLTIAAFFIALVETLKYRNIVKDESSDFKLLDLRWLYQFIFLIVPIIFFWGAELIRIALGGRGQSDLTIVIFVFIAIFIYYVSFKALTQQTLFEGSFKRLHENTRLINKQNKQDNSISPEIYDKIEEEMEANEYFLNQNLTLHDFAKYINTPARIISTSINQVASNNFNEWVNNFRVERAIELLADERSNYLSIEGVGAEAGFKSRSSMYMAFKNKTGKSPGHFRAV